VAYLLSPAYHFTLRRHLEKHNVPLLSVTAASEEPWASFMFIPHPLLSEKIALSAPFWFLA
jgi:hypothetical protein